MDNNIPFLMFGSFLTGVLSGYYLWGAYKMIRLKKIREVMRRLEVVEEFRKTRGEEFMKMAGKPKDGKTEEA